MSSRGIVLAVDRRFNSLVFAGALCLWAAVTGCSSTRPTVRGRIERSAAKMSFVSWNVRSILTTPREAKQSRALRIASLSNRELYRLMQTYPAPDLSTISGSWHGINKGVGPALGGLMQDVKVIESSTSSSGSRCRITGHKVLVKQVSIDEMACHGWQPQLDRETCVILRVKTSHLFASQNQPFFVGG